MNKTLSVICSCRCFCICSYCFGYQKMIITYSDRLIGRMVRLNTVSFSSFFSSIDTTCLFRQTITTNKRAQPDKKRKSCSVPIGVKCDTLTPTFLEFLSFPPSHLIPLITVFLINSTLVFGLCLFETAFDVRYFTKSYFIIISRNCQQFFLSFFFLCSCYASTSFLRFINAQ